MKKLFICIAFLVGIASLTNAQTATLTAQSGQTYIDYTTDNTLTNTTAKWFEFDFQPDFYNAQSVVINLDSTSGNHTNVAIALYGRINSEQTTWTAIGSTINWKGTTSDTTILITNSTESAYRQFKLLFTGTGTGTTKIDRQSFKIWYGLP